jgi:hypothetical protein
MASYVTLLDQNGDISRRLKFYFAMENILYLY